MKMKKLPKPKLPELKRPGLPVKHEPVTGKTVEQHRHEIIGRARKYIYPLRATKRRIVLVSSTILAVAAVIFLVVCGVLLYKFQNGSTFIYRVTQVVPFPVARVDGNFVAYENYLFQVRHYVHYYSFRTQQPTDFSTKSGQDQLNHYKHQALQQVINFAYVKQLAKEHNVTVSQKDVDASLALAKSRLGNNGQEFADVLQSFWGWSVDDYRRELSQELLTEKVASTLDVSAHSEANTVLAKLKSGASFSDLAKQYSDDPATNDSGGVYHELVTQANTDLPPQVVAAAFKLKVGQYSGVINTGYSLEILKLVADNNNQLQLAHIQINLNPISKYIAPLEAKHPPTYYIALPKA